jgi:hypothetical protein
LEPWIKTLLESAHAKHVNRFFEEKLQLGAVWRSCPQFCAASLSLSVIFPKISSYCRSRAKASTFLGSKNGIA